MSAGTTRRTVRVEDHLWEAAHTKATREGTTVSERVRASLREYVHGAVPERRTIADSLVYLVPDKLEDLQGPAFGTVELPIHLDWGPERHYNIDDDASCSALYQLTLQNSGSVEEICRIVNAERLAKLWSTMLLPTRCRGAWEAVFPELPAYTEAKEHPSWTNLSE
jgi:hypothetical protein